MCRRFLYVVCMGEYTDICTELKSHFSHQARLCAGVSSWKSLKPHGLPWAAFLAGAQGQCKANSILVTFPLDFSILLHLASSSSKKPSSPCRAFTLGLFPNVLLTCLHSGANLIRFVSCFPPPILSNLKYNMMIDLGPWGFPHHRCQWRDGKEVIPCFHRSWPTYQLDLQPRDPAFELCWMPVWWLLQQSSKFGNSLLPWM